MNQVVKNKDFINSLCQKHSVKSLFVFGSILTDKFTENSDIDMLVDIDANDPYVYTDHYFDLKDALEQLFHRPIDLLEAKTLKNPFLKENIEKTKVLVYGR